jgi:hypothetical protein
MNALMLTTDLELKTKLQQLCAAMSPPITLLPDMPGMLRLDPVAIAVPDLVFFDARGEQHLLGNDRDERCWRGRDGS